MFRPAARLLDVVVRRVGIESQSTSQGPRRFRGRRGRNEGGLAVFYGTIYNCRFQLSLVGSAFHLIHGSLETGNGVLGGNSIPAMVVQQSVIQSQRWWFFTYARMRWNNHLDDVAVFRRQKGSTMKWSGHWCRPWFSSRVGRR
ncbi:hypothetical protein RchiOBHm_Chr6g0294371 [Rosa chinensis]|uniref:Uncharacterized protein n=1 Tax=Rosa chinensis TaxID=74649 RepID=A0A2P6PWX2_ROSCH|nr:hypothetical protein RchiOBHm_Chr6g0294371 [Rosa chinensis]